MNKIRKVMYVNPTFQDIEDEFEDVVEAVGDSTTQWFLRTLQIAPKLLFNSSFLAILVTSGLSGLWFFMSISSETVDLTAVVITSPSLSVVLATTRTGIETASRPSPDDLGFLEAAVWANSSAWRNSSGAPPSLRVGLGSKLVWPCFCPFRCRLNQGHL